MFDAQVEHVCKMPLLLQLLPRHGCPEGLRKADRDERVISRIASQG